MPEREQLIIRLRVDGRIEAHTRNIYGDTCVPFASILEDLCDAEAVESHYTPDHHVTAATVSASKEQQHDNG